MKFTFTFAIIFAFITNANSQPFCKVYSESQKSAFRQAQLLVTGADYDVKYHRCEWQVDPANPGITGKVTTYFQSISGLSSVEFDFSDSMTVDSITGQNANLAFTHANNIIHITLNNALTVGAVDSVAIYYHGIPSSSGFGSFTYDKHGSDSIPIASTLSEPYGASDWWPCKQTTYDKVDSADILITCPSNNLAGSNGKLMSITPAGNNHIIHWQVRYPMVTYLFGISVTEYAHYSHYLHLQGGDSLEILNYVYRDDSAAAAASSPDIVRIISNYDSLFIEYPFKNEKYGHAQWNWGGGEEHQTMSFMSDLNFSLMAHECGHQWFGDYITCGSYEDIWLNEGFATYLEALSEEFLIGSANWENWKSVVRADITLYPDGSVLCTDTTDLSRLFDFRLTYEKGAFVNHMLRWELGDSTYFAALRNYLNDPALKYGFARTPDLKHHLETTSGTNLTTFFDQWYYHEGYPTYDVQWNFNSGIATVQINQLQSHPSVSFFKMHVPIKFIGVSGDTTVVFDHNFSGEMFTTPLSFTPTSVQFDPEQWILSGNNTVTFNSSIGIQKIDGSEFAIYPNPVNDRLFIQSNNYKGKSSVELINNVGQKVFEAVITIENNSFNEINVSTLPVGIYTVVINSETGRTAGRVCKY
jgi:aminopeptidase N